MRVRIPYAATVTTMKSFITFGLLITAALTGACTGLERESSSVLAPSPVATTSAQTPTSPSAPSLLGTWSSNPLSGISASSCTGFSWQVTSQTSTSIAGTFSATCANGISASGTASGTLSGANVPYTVTGNGTMPGFPSCPFSLTGTAVIVDSDTLRIPYAGTTCLGPVSGEETLRRPTTSQPPTPPPTAPPAHPPTQPPNDPPPPAEHPHHVGPGPLTFARTEQVINATADEFPQLLVARSTEGEAQAAATELLRRIIWHLRRAGYEAGRQKNPSGAISGDKLTVFADGAWRAIDVFYDYGTPGVPVRVIFWEVFPANPIGDEGIPD